MNEPNKPSVRRLSRATVAIGVIVAAMVIAIFVGMNLSHFSTLKEEQATGQNEATSFDTEPKR